jgi:hypothetical protein
MGGSWTRENNTSSRTSSVYRKWKHQRKPEKIRQYLHDLVDNDVELLNVVMNLDEDAIPLWKIIAKECHRRDCLALRQDNKHDVGTGTNSDDDDDDNDYEGNGDEMQLITSTTIEHHQVFTHSWARGCSQMYNSGLYICLFGYNSWTRKTISAAARIPWDNQYSIAWTIVYLRHGLEIDGSITSQFLPTSS